ncbi:MAG: transposase [Gammaproteobacteria bacterium]|nr:transposase [Gammaproteobacteria bacterium]
MGRSRYKFTQPDQPHFITLTVLHWIPIFTRPKTVQIIFDAIKHLQLEGLKVYAYVVLENHLHMVAQSPKLDRDISRLKSFTARQLINYFHQHKLNTILDQLKHYKKAHKHNRALQLWQEGVHPELIQNHSMMTQKVDYIHFNPVKRGYVEVAEHWCYSSARDYEGHHGILDICTQW